MSVLLNVSSCVSRKINTRRITTKRVEEEILNEHISPKVEQHH